MTSHDIVQPAQGPASVISSPHGRNRTSCCLFIRTVLPIWICVAVLLIIVSWERLIEMRFSDPDDLLRMVQVRDWLNGQHWFDVSQHRMNPPMGAPMHWSRLVDLPIALVIQLLHPLLGTPQAEIGAAIFVPLATLLALMTVLALSADRLFGRREALFACLIAGSAVPIIQQLQPYRVDHHGWQLVCTALVMLGMFDPQARRGGWIAGTAMATLLTISIEGLPLATGAMIVLGLSWVMRRRGDHDGTRLESAAVALATISTSLWVLTRLPQGMTVWCDAISAVHLVTFAAAAAGVVLSRRFASGVGAQFLGLVATATIAAAILVLSAPQCASGAFTDLPPLVRKYWYENIAEGLPIWDQRLTTIWTSFSLLLVAICGLVMLWREYPERRGDWAAIAGLLSVSTLAAVFVARASAAAAVIQIPIAAYVACRIFYRCREIQSSGPRIVATAASISLLSPSATLGPLLPVGETARAQRSSVAESEDACLSPRRLHLVNAVLGERGDTPDVFAPLDIGPALLFATDATVVASSHHRNKKAMDDVIRFWIGSPQQAQAIAGARRTEYVLYCPDIAEPQLYSNVAPNGMMAQLIGGRTPDWLQKVHDPRLGPIQLYRVMRHKLFREPA